MPCGARHRCCIASARKSRSTCARIAAIDASSSRSRKSLLLGSGVPALAVSGVMDRAVSATRPATKAATDFERIFFGNVVAVVLYIVSSLRKLQWLLRQTKDWSKSNDSHGTLGKI